MQIKKWFLMTCSIWLTSGLVAQITIQPAIPAVGLIQKNQLWNVMIINSSNKQYDCRLELVLRDRSNGQEVMTATTGLFTIAAGAKQLNAAVVNPVQYNYILPAINNKLQGLVPAGAYTACYALLSVAAKEVHLAEECIPFDAEPLSPPMLIFPGDSALLQNAPTQLSWIPPTPDGMFDRLRYEIIITEIMEGQKAGEAIQENIPFYSDATLYNTMLNYPGSAVSFEKNKWYAWQVVAKDDRNYAGKSEVWVFKINKDSIAAKHTNPSYIFINGNAAENNIFNIPGKELYIKYYSLQKNTDARLFIKNAEGAILQQLTQSIIYGDNYFTIPLSDNINKGQLYKAEISGLDNKAFSILFIIND
jgi:hypothetical protein